MYDCIMYYTKIQKKCSQLCTESQPIPDVHLDSHNSGVLGYFVIQLPECHRVHTLVLLTGNTSDLRMMTYIDIVGLI